MTGDTNLDDPLADVETCAKLLATAANANDLDGDCILYLVNRLEEHVDQLRKAYEADLQAQAGAS